jgi:hypothetical protein
MMRQDPLEQWGDRHRQAAPPSAFAEGVMRRLHDGALPKAAGVRRSAMGPLRIGLCAVGGLLALARIVVWFAIFIPS